LSSACATDPLPTFPNLETPAALALAASRAIAPPPIRATGSVTLTRRDGTSVTFDAALAASAAGHARLRAWKVGQAAFDLTLTPRGLWVFAQRPDAPGNDPFLGLTHQRFALLWALLRAGFFEQTSVVIAETAEVFILERAMDSALVRCTLDRSTLTPLAYEILDDRDAPVARLELSRYRLIDGRPFPARFLATGELGSIETDLDEIEIDPAIPVEVFNPPPRAVRRP